jgi:3-deoxy-manno-octulosonate cytidylyltransferase (CMP-KDO synthetase)
LPDKLLLAETGTPVIIHTCQAAAVAVGAENVVVCCDDVALAQPARAAGFTAHLTDPALPSGTDRIAAVVAAMEQPPAIVVNVQGDEPEIDPEAIRLVAQALYYNPDAGMATLVTAGNATDQADPNAVKAICAANGRALYFTRAPAVWQRDAQAALATCWRHVGIYAYRSDVLLQLAALPPCALEESEKLEQLRALDAGVIMQTAVIEAAPIGIDTRADYEAFLARYQEAQA